MNFLSSVFDLILTIIAYVWFTHYFLSRIRNALESGKTRHFLIPGITSREKNPFRYWARVSFEGALVVAAFGFFLYSIYETFKQPNQPVAEAGSDGSLYSYIRSMIEGPTEVLLVVALIVLNYPLFLFFFRMLFVDIKDSFQQVVLSCEPTTVSVFKGPKRTSDTIWAGNTLMFFLFACCSVVLIEFVLLKYLVF